MTDIALSRFVPAYAEVDRSSLARTRLNRIEKIVDRDRETFDRWSGQPGAKQRLDMPYQAWRCLIPFPVFALATDPSRVHVLTLDHNPKQQNILIVERAKGPITNRSSLDMYKKALHEYIERKRNATAEESAAMIEPEKPEDVDRFHALHYLLVKNGKLRITDYVINEIMLSSRGNRLHVTAYYDREELHHFRIASTFYEQLYYIAKALGYRFVTGRNKNPGFFINQLGRKSLSQVKPQYQGEFLPRYEEIDPAEFTIRFLYPEDERRYTKSAS